MWLLTLVGVFACYFLSEKSKNPRKFFLISAGIVIVLILGSRYFINGFTDEITYNYLYQEYSKINFSELVALRWGERDFGFYLTYWCMAHIIPWAQFPIYFITALFTAVTFRFIYKNSNATLTPVLFMFAFGTFSFYMAAYRQCFAMCLCIIAFEFAKKRGLCGLLPYAALMFIASTMHISSVVFIPIYFFIRIKKDAKGYIAWCASLIFVAVSAVAIMTYAAEVIEKDGYLDSAEFSSLGLYIQIILISVPFIISLLSLVKYDRIANVQYVMMILASIGAIILLYKFVYPAYERVSYYYTFFVIAAFSNSIVNIRQKKGEINLVQPAEMIISVLLVVLLLWRMPDDLVFFWQGN